MEQKWDLGNSCEGKFKESEEVETRGDMGNFPLRITQIHNSHYAECEDPFGGLHHFNMNCLQMRNEK